MVSADSVQLPKNAGELQQLWDDLDNSFASVGVTDIALQKPSAIIEQCAAAVRKGLPVVGLLSKGAVLTLLESRRGSLGSLGYLFSGVRSWIALATTVVMMWLQCYRCAGSAQNYAGHLLQVCRNVAGVAGVALCGTVCSYRSFSGDCGNVDWPQESFPRHAMC